METLPGVMDFTTQPVAAYSADRSSGGPQTFCGYGKLPSHVGVAEDPPSGCARPARSLRLSWPKKALPGSAVDSDGTAGIDFRSASFNLSAGNGTPSTLSLPAGAL